MRAAVRLGVALVLVALGAVACGSDDEGPDFPAFTAPVVDAVDRVPDDVERRVNAALLDFQRRTTNQIAVAVIGTTGDMSLEDYAIDLAREWGVGLEEEDNGVLLLIAMDDRRVRIETGLQLDDELTDLEAGRIVDERLVPLLREGDVGAAVEQGTEAIRTELGDPLVGELPPLPVDEPAGDGGTDFPLWGVLPVLIVIALASAAGGAGRRGGRGRGFGAGPIIWGGGFGGGLGGGFGRGGGFGGGRGGGFGGGGGGGFGGGGASGGW